MDDKLYTRLKNYVDGKQPGDTPLEIRSQKAVLPKKK